MSGKAKRSDALGIAIRMEEEGIQFYSKAAEQAENTLAKKMFASLVKDEERHRAIFQEMATQEGVRPSRANELEESSPAKRIQSIFKGAAAKAKKSLKSTDEVVRALDIALGMEEKAYFFYAGAARTMADAQEKEILLKIAEEENEHFRILNDTRLYLTYPQMWNIIQEKPVIDGAF
jgi:rubrerythrin